MDVLVVDDDDSIRQSTGLTIASGGHSAHSARNSKEAIDSLQAQKCDVILLDLRLDDENGLDLLDYCKQHWPEIPVVVFTAFSTVDVAVEAMRRGADDFLVKPFEPPQLRRLLERVTGMEGSSAEFNGRITDVVEPPPLRLRSRDPKMQEVLRVARKAAPTQANILLLGPSGSGKSHLARYLHQSSSLAERPFITVNCPCLSRELLESELFGHAKGSFTGAHKDTEGKVAAADGGTLFLDEIGEMPLEIQPKLLRLVQEKSYERIGETRVRTAQVRIIAATNRDLRDAVAEGKFREDLYFRLNVISMQMPALNERPEDLKQFVQDFLKLFSHQDGKNVKNIEPAAMEALLSYNWPGNIRELRNVIERAVILCEKDTVLLTDLPEHLVDPSLRIASRDPLNGQSQIIGESLSLEELELEHIRQVLERTKTLGEAAKILDIDPATLYRKRKKLESRSQSRS